ncbi:hypothetical protein M9Y10_017372 [Tritrichomonas musculus]|uniref:MatE family protein n=1 Tax=Tritrichomonas musculus TaxID=1915356 RepID=A0ABR2HU82_9EUKA
MSESNQDPLLGNSENAKQNNENNEVPEGEDFNPNDHVAQEYDVGNLNPEESKLGKDSAPLRILKDSFGPFLGEIVSASYVFVDAFWISKYVGTEGNAVTVIANILDNLCRSFGFFMKESAASHFSRLHGEGRKDEIPHLFADLFCLCLIFGVLVPLIFIPLNWPLEKLFKVEEKKMNREYVFPLILSCFSICINQLLNGCLQSEGRNFIYGISQICSAVLNMCVFDPLFMGPCKLGILGASLSTVVSEFLVQFTLFCLFLSGNFFDTKIDLKLAFKKWSPEVWPAVKIGISKFISHISFFIPTFFSRGYGVRCAANENEKAAMQYSMNLWYFGYTYSQAIYSSYLPAASYAHGRQDFKRMLNLLIVSIAYVLIWCGFAEVVILSLRNIYPKIYTNDYDLIITTGKMIFTSYLATVLMGLVYVAESTLMSLEMTGKCMILSVLSELVPVPLFSTILYFSMKNKKSIVTLFYMYTCNDAFAGLVSLFFLIDPIVKLRRLIKGINPVPLITENMLKST